jgi:dTDP-4-dehydrorhamnose 3,5-epimerase
LRAPSVAVDVRQGSPNFGRHVAVELREDNRRQLWIPRGFAHGFVVLSETADFFYKCDNLYSSKDEILGILRSFDFHLPPLWRVADLDVHAHAHRVSLTTVDQGTGLEDQEGSK